MTNLRLVVAVRGANAKAPVGRRPPESAANTVEDLAPSRVPLSGQPAEALIGCANEEGYDVLAIGRCGRGASEALLGSTAARSVDGPIPTLIV